MTLEAIVQSLKKKYSNFGLKDKGIEKLANIIKTNMDAMGAIENEESVLNSQVDAMEPYLGVMQSEIDARVAAARQPQLAPQPQPTPQPEPQPQPTPQAPEIPKELKEMYEFYQSQKSQQQQQAAYQNRQTLMKQVRDKINPNGTLDEATVWSLFAQNADKFVDGANIDELGKTFQEMYNQQAVSQVPQNPFMPSQAVPGAAVADTAKQAATGELIDKFIKDRRL